jgi:hypothetical protein
MFDKNYDKERRDQARTERLGSNNPKCLFCDENDLCCLERHHISGKKFGDYCVIVCRNHHRKLSEKQRDHPPVLPGVPNKVECIGRLLLGLADAFEVAKAPLSLVDLLRQPGLDLIEYGQDLRTGDGEQP